MQIRCSGIGYRAGGDPLSGKSGQIIADGLQEPTGFPVRADSTIAFVDGTRTWTITPAVTSFDVYEIGVRYNKTSAESVIIDNTVGLHLIYYDEGVLKSLANPNPGQLETFIRTKALAGYVYWDGTASIYVADERHGTQMSGATHAYLHSFEGCRYSSGLTPDPLLTVDADGDDDDAAKINITNGAIVDEDIYLTIEDGSPQNLDPVLQAPVWYLSGSTWTKDAATDYPVKNVIGGRLAYNDVTLGTQVEVAHKKFVLAHIFATNDIYTPIIAIQGQNEYDKHKDAKSGANEEIAFLIVADMPFAEFSPICTLIYETKDDFSSATMSRIKKGDDNAPFVDWRFSNITPAPGSAVSHAALTDLLLDNHSQYLLLAGRTGGQTISQSLGFEIDTIVSNTTVDDTHYTILLDGTSNTVTATLPTAVGRQGRVYILKSINTTFQCDVATAGTEEIDGSSSNRVLVLNDPLRIQSDGVNWRII